MKSTSNSNRFYSNSRLLIGFLVVLLSGCVLLAGFGAISKTFAVRISSPRAVPANSLALSSKYDVAFGPGPARRLDEQGNRPEGMSFLPLAPAKNSCNPAHWKWRLVLAWAARWRC